MDYLLHIILQRKCLQKEEENNVHNLLKKINTLISGILIRLKLKQGINCDESIFHEFCNILVHRLGQCRPIIIAQKPYYSIDNLVSIDFPRP